MRMLIRQHRPGLIAFEELMDAARDPAQGDGEGDQPGQQKHAAARGMTHAVSIAWSSRRLTSGQVECHGGDSDQGFGHVLCLKVGEAAPGSCRLMGVSLEPGDPFEIGG